MDITTSHLKKEIVALHQQKLELEHALHASRSEVQDLRQQLAVCKIAATEEADMTNQTIRHQLRESQAALAAVKTRLVAQSKELHILRTSQPPPDTGFSHSPSPRRPEGPTISHDPHNPTSGSIAAPLAEEEVLQTTIYALQGALRTSQSRTMEAQQSAASAVRESQVLNAQLLVTQSEHVAEITRLSSQLNHSEAKSKEIINVLEETVKSLRIDLETNKNSSVEVCRLTSKLSVCQHEIENLKAECASLRTVNQNLISRHKEEMQAVRDKSVSPDIVSHQCDEINHLKDILQRTHEAHQMEIGVAQDRCRHLQDEAETFKAEVEKLKKANTLLDQELILRNDVIRELSSRVGELHTLRSENAHLNNALRVSATEMSEVRISVENIVKDVAREAAAQEASRWIGEVNKLKAQSADHISRFHRVLTAASQLSIAKGNDEIQSTVTTLRQMVAELVQNYK